MIRCFSPWPVVSGKHSISWRAHLPGLEQFFYDPGYCHLHCHFPPPSIPSPSAAGRSLSLPQEAQTFPRCGCAPGLMMSAIHHRHGFSPSPGLPLPRELPALLSLKHRIVLSRAVFTGRQSHEEQNRIMGVGYSQGPRAGCATLGRPLKTSLQSSLFMKWGPVFSS